MIRRRLSGSGAADVDGNPAVSADPGVQASPSLGAPGDRVPAALVDRLLASHHVPVVCVVAPAGYGKTTLLSQWAEQRGRTAWVSLDERDNDPEILLACAAAALDQVEAIDPELLGTRWLGGLDRGDRRHPPGGRDVRNGGTGRSGPGPR